MKTTLPATITTIEQAKQFLTTLNENGEVYHPEDDAHTIIWHLPAHQCPTPQECDRLNQLMEAIYALPGNEGRHSDLAFDPCQWILQLNNHFQTIFN